MPTEVCRAKTSEGEFLRGAGIDKHWVTSSGYMSCITAGGKWLGHAPTAKVVEAFQKLPESERKPGAVTVAAMSVQDQIIPTPPPGGLVLRVHGRFMARDDKGNLRHVRADDFPQLQGKESAQRSHQFIFEPNTEYMWLTAEEWKALVPSEPAKGQQVKIDPALAERIARFHLVPRRALTSEDGILPRKNVKQARLSLVVENVSPERIQLKLAGFVHTGSDYDAAKATSPDGPLGFGYETPLHGILEYDRAKSVFVRFDVIAPGDVWGRWGDANGKSMTIERPGRTPICFAFELATGETPTNRIPPGGHGGRAARNGYFGPNK